MQSINNNNVRMVRFFFTGLIIVQIILLVLSKNVFVAFLSSLILFIFFIITFHFWFYFIDLDSSFLENSKLLMQIMHDVFTSRSTFLVLKAGKTNQEYFLLKKKPLVRYLYIDNDSAAIISKPNDQLDVITAGLYHLAKGEKLFSTIDLKLRHFSYGPADSENPFELMKSGESYTDFHARQLRSQKVKATTKDNYEIYASFNIYYQLAPACGETYPEYKNSILRIGQYLFKDNLDGEAANHIERLIEKAVSTHWIEIINQQSIGDIFQDQKKPNLLYTLNQLNLLFSAEFTNEKHQALNNFSADKLCIPLFKIYLKNFWVQTGKSTKRMIG